MNFPIAAILAMCVHDRVSIAVHCVWVITDRCHMNKLSFSAGQSTC